MLIGVEDNGNIIGLENTDYPTFKDKDKKDAFLKHLDNLIEKFLGNEYNGILNIDLEMVEGKTVAKVCMNKKAPEPVFLNVNEKGKPKREVFYIRRSVSAIELTIKETAKYIKEHWK